MTENEKIQVTRLREKGNGYGAIAAKLGISVNTVKSFCRRNTAVQKIQPVEKKKEYSGEVTVCENCGKEIRQIAKQKKRRFCCDKCRNEWWNSHLDRVKKKAVYQFICPNCGKQFQIYGDKRRKYCCHACSIADRFGGDSDD